MNPKPGTSRRINTLLRLWMVLSALALLLPAVRAAAQSGGSTLYLPLVSKSQVRPITAVLKWAYGGCYTSWCETGWYSSPAVLDIDGNGRSEIIASAYSLWALNGETGALLWRSGGTGHRTWPGVVVADLDRDGTSEIVIAQSGGLVSAYRPDGSLKWQKQPSGGAGARNVANILAQVAGNHVGEVCQALVKLPNDFRGGALLGAVHDRGAAWATERVVHIAGHDDFGRGDPRVEPGQVDPCDLRQGLAAGAVGQGAAACVEKPCSEGLDAARAAVGGCAASDAEDDPRHTTIQGGADELAGPQGRRLERVTLLDGYEWQAGGGGHLEDGGGRLAWLARWSGGRNGGGLARWCAGAHVSLWCACAHRTQEAPYGRYRLAERARDGRVLVRAIRGGDEGVNGAFSAVGHRAFVEDGVGKDRPQAAGDCLADLGGRKRLLETVGGDDDLHRRPVVRDPVRGGGAFYRARRETGGYIRSDRPSTCQIRKAT